MSYTNVELVRPYLVEGAPVEQTVRDQSLQMSGSGFMAFYRGPVDAQSVTVKSIRGRQTLQQPVTLNDGSAVIGNRPIVPGSLVVATDSSLGTLYDENRDYVIDYSAAVLTTKSGGSLGEDDSITVWCQPYSVYAVEEDYLLAAGRGEIRRLAGGDIADGESVLIDYRPAAASYSELLLETAVTQANGLVERAVDPEGRFGAEPALQVAATYRALELISRALAARELSGCSADRAALAWMSLGQTYGERADALLAGFRPPVIGPSGPRHS